MLGLGGQVQESSPNANFQFDYSTIEYDHSADANGPTSIERATMTHTGGDDVGTSNIGLHVGGQPPYSLDDMDGNDVSENTTEPFASGTVSAGMSDTTFFYNTDVWGGENYPGSNPVEDGTNFTGGRRCAIERRYYPPRVEFTERWVLTDHRRVRSPRLATHPRFSVS